MFSLCSQGHGGTRGRTGAGLGLWVGPHAVPGQPVTSIEVQNAPKKSGSYDPS
jgi:hypothetical protein